MSAVSVGTTAEELVNVDALIQNLGSVDLYVDITSSVTSTSGFRIEPGDSVAVGGGHTYYGVAASSTCDVRVLPGGIGGTAGLSTA